MRVPVVSRWLYRPQPLVLRFDGVEEEKVNQLGSDSRGAGRGLTSYDGVGWWRVESIPGGAQALHSIRELDTSRRYVVHTAAEPEGEFTFLTNQLRGTSRDPTAIGLVLKPLKPEHGIPMGQNTGINSRCHLLVGRGEVFTGQPDILRPRRHEKATVFAFQGQRQDPPPGPMQNPLFLAIVPAGIKRQVRLRMISGQATLWIWKEPHHKEVQWFVSYDGTEPIDGESLHTDLVTEDRPLRHQQHL